MRKIPIFAAIVVLIAQVISAHSQQQQHPRSRPLNLHSGTADSSRPTRVNGDGVTTPSGLKYWDLLAGTGEPATKGHAVTILYRAWQESGKELANSVMDKKPTVFTLGAEQVIPGLEEGMEGMKVGGRRQLRIPPELASGTSEMWPLVPPNKALIFDVELIELR